MRLLKIAYNDIFEVKDNIRDDRLAYDAARVLYPLFEEDKIAPVAYFKTILKSPVQSHAFLLETYKDVSKKNNWKYPPDFVKKAESVIARDPDSARGYARNVLKGPFPEGEKAIAQVPATAVYYALESLKKPFPLAEPVIAQHPYYLKMYFEEVLLEYFADGTEADYVRDFISKYSNKGYL